MTIEVSIAIAGVSLAFAIFQGISNMKRNNRKDAQADASQLTTVIVKLENIGNDIREMKDDLRSVKEDIKDHSARLIKVEERVKVLDKHVFRSNTEE